MFGPMIVQFLAKVWANHGEAILAAVMKKLMDKLNKPSPQGFDGVTSRVGVAAIPADVETELQKICDDCKEEIAKSQSDAGASPPSSFNG